MSRSLAIHSLVLIATLFAGVWTCTAQTIVASATPGATASAVAPRPADPPAEPAAPAQGQAAPAQDGFKMGDFTFKPGGRVKLDLIRDFKPIGSEDSFDVRTIPVDGSEGQNSNIHAKETRLSLDIRGPVQGNTLQMYLEVDFYGSSSVLRLRQAYGSWGPILAGQAWSTFVDVDTMPRTIDFEAPMAFASIRQAQVRFTKKMSDAASASVALEDNKSNITIPSTTPGKAEYPFPDLVGRYRFDDGKHHLQTSAFIGGARFRPTEGDPDNVTLWGWALSGKTVTYGKDTAYGVLTYGNGIGRYRGGTTAVPNPDNRLETVDGVAFMAGYEHFWQERWSTNAVYSWTDTSDRDFYTSQINKRLEYGAVNLLYWFLGDRAWTGVEYLYGKRQVFGSGSDSGTAHRIQYAVRFNLP